jgi:hypothetical protein
MTYLEAVSEIQKRSVDALKVLQSTQIASLQATRDLTAALMAPPLIGVPPLITAMANLTRTVAFQLLEQQIACAKSVTETLVAPVRALSTTVHEPLALTGTAELEALPRITPAPAPTAVLETVDAEHIEEAIIVEAKQAVEVQAAAIDGAVEVPVAVIDAAVEPEHASAAMLEEPPATTIGQVTEPIEAAAPQSQAVEPYVAEPHAAEPHAAESHSAESLATAALAAEAEPIVENISEPLDMAASQGVVSEPSGLHVELAGIESAAPEALDTADVLAKTLPPPKIAAPGPIESTAKAAEKKSKSAAAPGNRAKSKRRPGK